MKKLKRSMFIAKKQNKTQTPQGQSMFKLQAVLDLGPQQSPTFLSLSGTSVRWGFAPFYDISWHGC